MKQVIIFSFLLLFTVSLQGQSEVNVEKEKISIQDLFNKYSDGWKDLDIDKFAQIFLTSEDLVIITNTDKYIGWDSWKANIEEFFTIASNVVVTFRDEIIYIHTTGKVAWLSAIEDADWMKGDEIKSVRDMRLTWVLEKIDEDWKVVQGHWSLTATY